MSRTIRRDVSTAQCVFPNAVIPQSAWSEPAKHLLPYIPVPERRAPPRFSTGAYGKILRDDKGSFRVDVNTRALGRDFRLLLFRQLQPEQSLSHRTRRRRVFRVLRRSTWAARSSSTSATPKRSAPPSVNEVRLSYMRNANNVGQPSGGVGPSLASQGFVTGPGTPGIVPLAPEIEGIENVVFQFVRHGNADHESDAGQQYLLVDRQLLQGAAGHTRSRPVFR